jgi:alpha-galactosidase
MNNHRGAGQLITNLPADGCVEVACMIDRNGVNPTRFGALPRQMAALCDANMRMFDLGAQACIERSIEKAIYALMLDPLSAAVCSPAEIKQMTLELFKAEKKFLPGYK